MMKKTAFISLFALLTLMVLTSPAVAEQALHSGTWTKKTYGVDGAWKIVKEGGKTFVELDADFSTKKAPDLKLFLSPLSLSEVGNKNATKGSVLVSPLDSHKGAQRYALPAGTDLSQFKTVVIHCEKYSKLWAGSEL